MTETIMKHNSIVEQPAARESDNIDATSSEEDYNELARSLQSAREKLESADIALHEAKDNHKLFDQLQKVVDKRKLRKNDPIVFKRYSDDLTDLKNLIISGTIGEAQQKLIEQIEGNAKLRAEAEELQEQLKGSREEIQYLKMLIKMEEGAMPVSVPAELLFLLSNAINPGTDDGNHRYVYRGESFVKDITTGSCELNGERRVSRKSLDIPQVKRNSCAKQQYVSPKGSHNDIPPSSRLSSSRPSSPPSSRPSSRRSSRPSNKGRPSSSIQSSRRSSTISSSRDTSSDSSVRSDISVDIPKKKPKKKIAKPKNGKADKAKSTESATGKSHAAIKDKNKLMGEKNSGKKSESKGSSKKPELKESKREAKNNKFTAEKPQKKKTAKGGKVIKKKKTKATATKKPTEEKKVKDIVGLSGKSTDVEAAEPKLHAVQPTVLPAPRYSFLKYDDPSNIFVGINGFETKDANKVLINENQRLAGAMSTQALELEALKRQKDEMKKLIEIMSSSDISAQLDVCKTLIDKNADLQNTIIKLETALGSMYNFQNVERRENQRLNRLVQMAFDIKLTDSVSCPDMDLTEYSKFDRIKQNKTPFQERMPPSLKDDSLKSIEKNNKVSLTEEEIQPLTNEDETSLPPKEPAASPTYESRLPTYDHYRFPVQPQCAEYTYSANPTGQSIDSSVFPAVKKGIPEKTYAQQSVAQHAKSAVATSTVDKKQKSICSRMFALCCSPITSEKSSMSYTKQLPRVDNQDIPSYPQAVADCQQATLPYSLNTMYDLIEHNGKNVLQPTQKTNKNTMKMQPPILTLNNSCTLPAQNCTFATSYIAPQQYNMSYGTNQNGGISYSVQNNDIQNEKSVNCNKKKEELLDPYKIEKAAKKGMNGNESNFPNSSTQQPEQENYSEELEQTTIEQNQIPANSLRRGLSQQKHFHQPAQCPVQQCNAYDPGTILWSMQHFHPDQQLSHISQCSGSALHYPQHVANHDNAVQLNSAALRRKTAASYIPQAPQAKPCVIPYYYRPEESTQYISDATIIASPGNTGRTITPCYSFVCCNHGAP